jgi:hypothetical protein
MCQAWVWHFPPHKTKRNLHCSLKGSIRKHADCKSPEMFSFLATLAFGCCHLACMAARERSRQFNSKETDMMMCDQGGPSVPAVSESAIRSGRTGEASDQQRQYRIRGHDRKVKPPWHNTRDRLFLMTMMMMSPSQCKQRVTTRKVLKSICASMSDCF